MENVEISEALRGCAEVLVELCGQTSDPRLWMCAWVVAKCAEELGREDDAM